MLPGSKCQYEKAMCAFRNTKHEASPFHMKTVHMYYNYRLMMDDRNSFVFPRQYCDVIYEIINTSV